jgi:hypothetical protein
MDPKARKPFSFFSTPEFEENQRKSFARHRATPGISLNVHLALKERELKVALNGKKIVYLDTNHWINLRHVILNTPHQKMAYRVTLDLLSRLHAEGRICCPIGFLLFIELLKQSDPLTRNATAALMDRFSNGLCFQFPLELSRTELRHFMLRRIPSLQLEAKPWVWTKVGFLGGELFPTIPVVDEPTNLLMQKAWADMMWDIRLEQMLEADFDSFKKQSDFWGKYAQASNADAVTYRSVPVSYVEALQREKALLVRSLIQNDLEEIAQEIIRSFPSFQDPRTLRPVTESDYSPMNFPSMQILAGTNAANMLSTMKFEANDMLDFRHTATAIPYCDAVFCDNPMATRLRNKPCEFGKVYGTTILGRVEEINDYLRSLAG